MSIQIQSKLAHNQKELIRNHVLDMVSVKNELVAVATVNGLFTFSYSFNKEGHVVIGGGLSHYLEGR